MKQDTSDNSGSVQISAVAEKPNLKGFGVQQPITVVKNTAPAANIKKMLLFGGVALIIIISTIVYLTYAASKVPNIADKIGTWQLKIQ